MTANPIGHETNLTGLALLPMGDSPLIAPLLAIHLGVVFSLLLTMPYGKFVRGIHRFAALVRFAQEQRRAAPDRD